MIKNLVNISFILCLVDILIGYLTQIDKLVIVACDECHTQSMPSQCVKLELLLQNVGLDNEQLDTWKIENGHQLFIYPFHTLALRVEQSIVKIVYSHYLHLLRQKER